MLFLLPICLRSPLYCTIAVVRFDFYPASQWRPPWTRRYTTDRRRQKRYFSKQNCSRTVRRRCRVFNKIFNGACNFYNNLIGGLIDGSDNQTLNFAMGTNDVDPAAPPNEKRCTAHIFVPATTVAQHSGVSSTASTRAVHSRFPILIGTPLPLSLTPSTPAPSSIISALR